MNIVGLFISQYSRFVSSTSSLGLDRGIKETERCEVKRIAAYLLMISYGNVLTWDEDKKRQVQYVM